MIGAAIEWTDLARLPACCTEAGDPRLVRSALASSFVAALELAKQGKVEIAQAETFAPLMLRKGLRLMERPDDLVRAVEATLFACRSAAERRGDFAHLNGAAVEGALALSWRRTMPGAGSSWWSGAARWHFQTAPDLAHLLRREREDVRRLSRAATEALGDHRLSRAGEPRGNRGDPRRADRQGHARCADGSWLGARGRAARRAGAADDLCHDTSVSGAFRPYRSRRDLPGIEELRAAGLLDPVEAVFAGRWMR